jgi:cobalt transporter subunit CbtA
VIGRVILAAILAGLAAGLIMGVIQHVRLTPLILQAETLEHTGHSHSAEPHDHGGVEWQPANDLERTFFTTLTVMVTGAGFALSLAALVLLTGKALTTANAWIWGLAAFAAVAFAPSLSLPPQLPGMGALEFNLRQFWWLGTIACTSAGLWLLAYFKIYGWKLLGLALIALPHGLALPMPGAGASTVPAELAVRFATASLAANLTFWLMIAIFLAFGLKALKVDFNDA